MALYCVGVCTGLVMGALIMWLRLLSIGALDEDVVDEYLHYKEMERKKSL